MKRLITIACAVLCLCGSASAGKLDGKYKITAGKMPNKKKYVGTVQLTLTDGPSNQYAVAWTTGVAPNVTEAAGVAVVYGKRLIAQFSSTATGGVGYYDWCEIDGARGSLCGTFYGPSGAPLSAHGTMDSDGKHFAGTYSNAGDAGGDALTGFTITKVKKTVYALTWTLESGEVLQGVGIEADKRLYVAWGDATAGLALYKVKGKKLDGQWVSIGSSALGTEKLAKSK